MYKMAAHMTLSISRACSRCQKILVPMTVIARNQTPLNNKSPSALVQLLSASQLHSSSSHSVNEDTPTKQQYPSDFTVSYDEFKYVEQILPKSTVPEPAQHETYPTASGWFPPNEALQAQQKFLVRRTKNHMIPVYSFTYRTWYGLSHQVTVRKIEGDIWAFEAELRNYLIKKTGQKNIRTQVQEVARKVRVRGLHAPEVAEFLMERGM